MQRRFSNRGEACSETTAAKAKAAGSFPPMFNPKSRRVAGFAPSGPPRQERNLLRRRPRAPSATEPLF